MKFKKKFVKKYLGLIEYMNENKIHYILLAGMPFYLLDLFTKILSAKVLLFSIFSFVPTFFTLLWIFLVISTVLCSKKKMGKFLYTIFFLVALSLYFANNISFSLFGILFDFRLMGSVSEGAYYFWDVVVNANILIYIFGMIAFVLFIIVYKKIPYQRKYRPQPHIFTLLIFIVCHAITPLFLGEVNLELTWDTFLNPRNIYNNFNDNNKSFSITGLYEYSFRNFYITYLKPNKTDDQKEIEFLDNVFSDSLIKENNKYTGKLKDKNVIFLQFEGIDNWLLNKDVMPNTYALLNNSINFKNHYSYYNGGGSTFNSEFAVNTGYVTPITYTKNAYTFNKNNFPYSMPRLFKNANYENVNVFHMNNGEYYSRKINYETWGYDNYYGLKDLGQYRDDSYMLDRELINNQTFYDAMFTKAGKFVNYLITYTVHLPFNQDKGECKVLLNEQGLIPVEFTYNEEDCVKIQAQETDNMVGLLMQALKDNNLYDNTVIVAFTDHYLYSLEDKTVLDKYKETDNNLINNTPFFIWSKGLKKTTINKVSSQIDILPTVLNLMGISYQPNHYTGNDVLDPTYQELAIFSDYSWYDGKHYVEDGQILIGNKNNQTLIDEKNSYVDYVIRKNDLVLKYDYFKKIKTVQYEQVK